MFILDIKALDKALKVFILDIKVLTKTNIKIQSVKSKISLSKVNMDANVQYTPY